MYAKYIFYERLRDDFLLNVCGNKFLEIVTLVSTWTSILLKYNGKVQQGKTQMGILSEFSTNTFFVFPREHLHS